MIRNQKKTLYRKQYPENLIFLPLNNLNSSYNCISFFPRLNKIRQQRHIKNLAQHLRWNVLRKQLMVQNLQLFSQNAPSQMFDIVLNMPQSSTHFALTRRIHYFAIFLCGICGANVSMVMFHESFFFIVTFTLHLNVKNLQSPSNLN